MAWDTGNFIQGAAQGGIIPGLAQGFFGGNAAKAAQKRLRQIPGVLHENFDPWINYGQDVTQHPGERLNEIGQAYHESPGFKFALQQALQGAGHASAAGGMAGSPQHEFQNMEIATQLGNQDYNNWLKNALGLHQQAYSQGQKGGMQLGEDLASNLAQQAGVDYEGANTRNQQIGGAFGNLYGNAAALAAFL